MTDNANSTNNLDEIHKKLGKSCFNNCWNYLDKSSLSPEEELKMIELAHTSQYHWSFVGGPREFAISNWQVSRVYAKINEGNLSLKYAQNCLDITLQNKVEDGYLSAYEGIARAYSVVKDFSKANEFIAKAEKELEKVTDEEDREIYEPQIKETKSMIK